ncbi:uncharacterized protein LOC141649541 [Silene latifolia]|uniref:uncharacterized protein LOC141649541 n=1 Tax=Silene latifolia TaxID=37657 RepID=UPI003D77C989
MVLKELNRTFIALIPKCESPEWVGDYQPISLCNVFMRIVSKCITNRLGKVMGYLVGEFQNAFVPGRHISDNVLLAHEALHKINTHKKGKYGRFAFKADMSKAYDQVRWDFLQAVLQKVGFPERMVKLIMNCVTTVSYNVLFNGAPLQLFTPKCGLRQGDPLSPFLFVLCMEALSCTLDKANFNGSLKRIRLCSGVQTLTHLFFADDAVFFLQDQRNSFETLKGILDRYCHASGQIMNENKSGILFSPRISYGIIAQQSEANLSWGAKSVLRGLTFVRHHVGWKPGLDSGLNVWLHKWVGGDYPEPNDGILTMAHVAFCNLTINDLRCQSSSGLGTTWNETLIRQIFSEHYAKRILAIPIGRLRRNDEIYWLHNNDGEYSVKSGYGVLFGALMDSQGTTKDHLRLNDDGRLFCKRKLWRLPGPQMWKILVWRIITNSLSVGENFARRGMGVDTRCKMCNNGSMVMETLEHLFRDCPVSRRLWASSDIGIRASNGSHLPVGKWIMDWIYYLDKQECSAERVVRFLATIWCLWSI